MPNPIPNALVEAVKQRQAVLFVGAGMSYPALGILGEHVRNAIGNDIRKDFSDYDPAKRSFEDVCDEYVALNDRLGLVNRLAGLINQNIQAINVDKPTNELASGIESFMPELLARAGI